MKKVTVGGNMVFLPDDCKQAELFMLDPDYVIGQKIPSQIYDIAKDGEAKPAGEGIHEVTPFELYKAGAKIEAYTAPKSEEPEPEPEAAKPAKTAKTKK